MSEEIKVAWNGKGKHCQNGRLGVCLAAHFDGLVCKPGECRIASGKRQEPKQPEAVPVMPKRKPRPNRKRKARWRGTLGVQLYCFEYSPGEGVIRIWRHRHHKKRVITMTDLLHALEGQSLLPL